MGVGRAAAGVGDESNLAGVLAKNGRGEDAIVLVLCAGREVMCGKKTGKGVGGKGAEQVVKGFEFEQVPWWGQVAHFHTPRIKPPPKSGTNTFLSKSILLCVVPMCLITQEIK